MTIPLKMKIWRGEKRNNNYESTRSLYQEDEYYKNKS
jgi:hypothetical protein